MITVNRVRAYGANGLVSASDDGAVVFWDTRAKKWTDRILGQYKAPLLDVECGDHKIFSAGIDNTIRVSSIFYIFYFPRKKKGKEKKSPAVMFE